VCKNLLIRVVNTYRPYITYITANTCSSKPGGGGGGM